jgi:hypothetical protein
MNRRLKRASGVKLTESPNAYWLDSWLFTLIHAYSQLHIKDDPEGDPDFSVFASFCNFS